MRENVFGLLMGGLLTIGVAVMAPACAEPSSDDESSFDEAALRGGKKALDGGVANHCKCVKEDRVKPDAGRGKDGDATSDESDADDVSDESDETDARDGGRPAKKDKARKDPNSGDADCTCVDGGSDRGKPDVGRDDTKADGGRGRQDGTHRNPHAADGGV